MNDEFTEELHQRVLGMARATPCPESAETVVALAREAHGVFGRAATFPSATVVENIGMLLRQGWTAEEIRSVLEWRRTTKNPYAAKSAYTLTYWETFDKWWTMKNEEEQKPKHDDDSAKPTEPTGYSTGRIEELQRRWNSRVRVENL